MFLKHELRVTGQTRVELAGKTALQSYKASQGRRSLRPGWKSRGAREDLIFLAVGSYSFDLFFSFFFFFLGLQLWHMEVPRLGVRWEL